MIHASPCSTFPYTNAFRTFIYPFINNWKNVIDFVFGDEHQWPEIRRLMLYELERSTNVYLNLVSSEVHVNELVHRIYWPVDGPAPCEQWFKTPDSLYVIANAFNMCVIPIAQLNDWCLMSPLHVQWIHHRRRMLYELEHSTNVYLNLVSSEVCVNELVHRIHWPVDGPASYEHWFETPNSLYVIANAFNLCDTNCTAWFYDCVTFVIGLLTEQQHLIQLQLNDGCPIPPLHAQWIHHRTEQVSNLADLYQNRIAD
ncbi:hypothetical protein M9H77_30146 [Catharanthus roseus]|uniref:Uncharacterized protein n=1 Tax=Catharanthus roseus TaxID=4058 RepID=A0ACB9ZWR6_CATRO|nr:hypothetical protein M9H77_30146 [Catharanthus roseus]